MFQKFVTFVSDNKETLIKVGATVAGAVVGIVAANTLLGIAQPTTVAEVVDNVGEAAAQILES